MSSEHTISVAAASEGDAHRGGPSPVSIPVGELMANNGLVTGQSGADPAASARELAASLLSADETIFVVDPSGAFASLADRPTVLHVGGDRDCDVRVRPSAVDRVAALALEGDTSVVLDLQAFDAGAADDLLGGVTDALADAGRERAADLLLIVGECHRWLAADGPATRTGENLVHLGGRRHDGVGVLGVTDQPADVREDVLSGVDWLLAHRLTWQEDVRALDGLLPREQVDALEDLDDDVAVLNAGWERGVTRLRFGADGDRKSPTVPAESPPADDTLLADVPEARSPADDDATASAARDSTAGASDDEIAALREELEAVDDRIASLEGKIDAREDVEDLADRIAESITEGLRDAGVHGESGVAEQRGDSRRDETTRDRSSRDDTAKDETPVGDETAADADGDGPGGFGDVFGMFDDNDTVETPDTDGTAADADDGSAADANAGSTGDATDTGFGASESDAGGVGSPDGDSSESSGNGGGMSFEPIDFGLDEPGPEVDSTVADDFGPPSRRAQSGRSIPRYLRKIVRSIEEMDATTRKMLAYYIDQGTESPMDAHFSAGGGGDRTRAYAHNRQLRTTGLIEHVGKGEYAPRLREYVVDRAGHSVPEHELDRAVRIIEQTVEAA